MYLGTLNAYYILHFILFIQLAITKQMLISTVQCLLSIFEILVGSSYSSEFGLSIGKMIITSLSGHTLEMERWMW